VNSQKAVDPAAIRKAAVSDARPAFPLAPNLLADTKKFAKLCGGQANTEMEIIAAHDSATWRATIPSGGKVTGTLEVVTLEKLASHGIGFGGDLELATDKTFRQSDFRVALMEVTIKDGGENRLYLLSQNDGGDGPPLFTGSSRGQFRTQTACFVNVVSQSGNIAFRPLSGILQDNLLAGAELAGAGWRYLHQADTGWRTQPIFAFRGTGSMKVAMALPYLGTGDHGGAFIYAQSIGRYTHGDDRLPDGVAF